MEPSETKRSIAPSASQNLVEHLQRRRREQPTEEVPLVAPSTAQNLVEHLQHRHRPQPTEPGEPALERASPLDPPPLHGADDLRADWSERQRHCSHPETMVKRFADGLSYCRLCYACLTP